MSRSSYPHPENEQDAHRSPIYDSVLPNRTSHNYGSSDVDLGRYVGMKQHDTEYHESKLNLSHQQPNFTKSNSVIITGASEPVEVRQFRPVSGHNDGNHDNLGSHNSGNHNLGSHNSGNQVYNLSQAPTGSSHNLPIHSEIPIQHGNQYHVIAQVPAGTHNSHGSNFQVHNNLQAVNQPVYQHSQANSSHSNEHSSQNPYTVNHPHTTSTVLNNSSSYHINRNISNNHHQKNLKNKPSMSQHNNQNNSSNQHSNQNSNPNATKHQNNLNSQKISTHAQDALQVTKNSQDSKNQEAKLQEIRNANKMKNLKTYYLQTNVQTQRYCENLIKYSNSLKHKVDASYRILCGISPDNSIVTNENPANKKFLSGNPGGISTDHTSTTSPATVNPLAMINQQLSDVEKLFTTVTEYANALEKSRNDELKYRTILLNNLPQNTSRELEFQEEALAGDHPELYLEKSLFLPQFKRSTDSLVDVGRWLGEGRIPAKSNDQHLRPSFVSHFQHKNSQDSERKSNSSALAQVELQHKNTPYDLHDFQSTVVSLLEPRVKVVYDFYIRRNADMNRKMVAELREFIADIVRPEDYCDELYNKIISELRLPSINRANNSEELYSVLSCNKTEMKTLFERLDGSKHLVSCQIVMNPIFCIYFIYNLRTCEIGHIKILGTEEIDLLWSDSSRNGQTTLSHHEILNETSRYTVFREMEVCFKQIAEMINNSPEYKVDVTDLYTKFDDLKDRKEKTKLIPHYCLTKSAEKQGNKLKFFIHFAKIYRSQIFTPENRCCFCDKILSRTQKVHATWCEPDIEIVNIAFTTRKFRMFHRECKAFKGVINL